MYYVYKYVVNDTPVYIGKARDNLPNRIYDHSIDPKFSAYQDATIYWTQFANAAEMDAMELLLINYYKPRLNTASKYQSCSINDLPSIQWHSLDEYKSSRSSKGDCKNNTLTQLKRSQTRLHNLILDKERLIGENQANLNGLSSFLAWVTDNIDLLMESESCRGEVPESIGRWFAHYTASPINPPLAVTTGAPLFVSASFTTYDEVVGIKFDRRSLEHLKRNPQSVSGAIEKYNAAVYKALAQLDIKINNCNSKITALSSLLSDAASGDQYESERCC